MTGQTSGSLTVYRVPRSHWHCTLEDFRYEGVQPASLRARLGDFCAEVAAGGAPHLILAGAPGIGKTHLAVALYRWAVTLFGTRLATIVNVPEFCAAVKASYGTPGEDLFAEYTDARRFVALDDLFGRDLTAYESGQIVHRLIDIAYQNAAGVVVTLNQDVRDLSARLPEHEVSRLLSRATLIPMQGTDQRRGGGKR